MLSLFLGHPVIHPLSGGCDEIELNTADLTVGHYLCEGQGAHKNIPVSNIKLPPGLLVGYISSHLAADEPFPVSTKVITGPQNNRNPPA